MILPSMCLLSIAVLSNLTLFLLFLPNSDVLF